MLSKLKELLKHSALRRSFFLYVSFLCFGGAVFLFNTLAARSLTPEMFGTLSLAVSIVSTLAYFLDFGVSFAGSNIINQYQSANDVSGIRSFLGLYFLLQIAFAFIAAIALGAVTIAIDVTKPELAQLIFAALPLGCFFSSQIYLTNLLKGGRLLKSLIAFMLVETVVLLSTPFLTASGLASPVNLVRIYFGSVPAGIAVVFLLARPTFNGLSDKMIELKQKLRSYGFRVYASSMLAQLTFYLDSLLIGFFHENRQVGIYNLGMMVINIVFLFSHSYSQANFHAFSQARVIPRHVLKVNLAWLLVTVTVGLIIKNWVISMFFGPAYADVSTVLWILLPAVFFKALYQPYILFLHAHSVAKISSVETKLSFFNLAVNLALIPPFGVQGAAVATLLSFVAYFVMILLLYRTTTAGMKSAEQSVAGKAE